MTAYHDGKHRPLCSESLALFCKLYNMIDLPFKLSCWPFFNSRRLSLTTLTDTSSRTIVCLNGMVFSTYCKECQITVPMSWKNHHRVVHQQTVQVTYQDSVFEMLQRCSETRQFHCPCGLFSSPNPNSLRQHTQEHNHSPNKVASPRITVPPIAVATSHHGKMSSELKGIVC
jgi:hypothetical protein